MADLDRLAQAATDAITAAEQRGFDRALTLIETKLQESPHLCVHFSAYGLPECAVVVEIPYDDDSRCIVSRKVALSDVIYEQYPTCEGSVRKIAATVRLSLAEVDRILENWGKEAPADGGAHG